MLQNPPGFVVRTEAHKAAWDNSYRFELGIEDGWLHYASTTAPCPIWIAGASDVGTWLLSVDHSGVAGEIGAALASLVSLVPGPGVLTLALATLAELLRAKLVHRIRSGMLRRPRGG